VITEILNKRKFDITSDRIGPDLPFSHWRLYFKTTMKKLCISKFKYFSSTAEFRPGAYAVTCSKISIGKRVVVRPNTILMADPRSGEDGSIVIGDDVLVGSGVHIYVANHDYTEGGKNIIDMGHCPPKSVVLEEGCWIGANCILLPGVRIGKKSVVGAGSVVTKDVPPCVVAAGNPASIIKNCSFS